MNVKEKAIKSLEGFRLNVVLGLDVDYDVYKTDDIEKAIQIALNEQALKILDEILRQRVEKFKGLGIHIAGGNLTLIILKDTNLSFLETNPIWYKYFPKSKKGGMKLGEPLKNKGTEGIKFVDFIIGLFEQQVEILNKQEGVEASLNEEEVKEMKRKGKEMLGNTKVYEDKEIKSAVEWLKETLNQLNKVDGELTYNKTFELIDQAFPDLQPK